MLHAILTKMDMVVTTTDELRSENQELRDKLASLETRMQNSDAPSPHAPSQDHKQSGGQLLSPPLRTENNEQRTEQ